MTVNDVYGVIQGTICIYQKIEDSEDPEFENLYKGDKYGIPKELLEKEVFVMAGARNSVLDVQVKA